MHALLISFESIISSPGSSKDGFFWDGSILKVLFMSGTSSLMLHSKQKNIQMASQRITQSQRHITRDILTY